MSPPPTPPPPSKPLITNMTLRSVPWDHPDSIHLRSLQRIEINSQGGCDPGTPPSAADVPVFLIAYCDDVPAGCGGLRPLPSPGAAEVKRMFVLPAYRGVLRGADGREREMSVVGVVLEGLEQEARVRGWGMLFLETGAFLVKARRFYERCGFVPCELFGGYRESDDSVCYEKRIGGVSRGCEGVGL